MMIAGSTRFRFDLNPAHSSARSLGMILLVTSVDLDDGSVVSAEYQVAFFGDGMNND